MRELGRRYPHAGYGGSFITWLRVQEPRPYYSFGNGAAMRVSPCAYGAHTLKEAKKVSRAVTAVTHDHPEGIKGAEATTVAIFMARERRSKEDIRQLISRDYYPLNFTLDEIRPTYEFDVTCQGTVPQAIVAFLESTVLRTPSATPYPSAGTATPWRPSPAASPRRIMAFRMTSGARRCSTWTRRKKKF